MQNTIDPIITAGSLVTFAVSIYFYLSSNKTGKLYIKNAKELIKVKEDLIETKTELIRKMELCKDFRSEADYFTKRYNLISENFNEQEQKIHSVLHNIYSLNRRISIKELAEFRQRIAEIYPVTTPE